MGRPRKIGEAEITQPVEETVEETVEHSPIVTTSELVEVGGEEKLKVTYEDGAVEYLFF